MVDDSFVLASAVIEKYADVLVADTSSDYFGVGWADIVKIMLDALAAYLAPMSNVQIRFTRMRAVAGRLVTIAHPTHDNEFPGVNVGAVRRIIQEAGDTSLRTCDVCGQGGMLRHISGGRYATRCRTHEAYVLAGPRTLRADPIGSIVGSAMLSHAEWLDSQSAKIDVPTGWLPMTVEAFARLSRLARPASGRVRLLSVAPVCGRLDQRIEHAVDDFTIDHYVEWRDALNAIGDAAFWVCDVCGRPGVSRWPKAGAPTPRCDAHNDFKMHPSAQRMLQVGEVSTLTVLSSARAQWTAGIINADPTRSMRAAMRVTETQRTIGSAGGHALYRLEDVASALGLANDEGDDEFDEIGPKDNEQQARLRRILKNGEEGRWRHLAMPDHTMVERLDVLAARAPHLEPLSTCVRNHLLAAIHMGTPITLPPLLVVGEPGVGKTWFLSALAEVLGIPFSGQPMSSASLSDAISGAHGSWRNSQAGLVAKLLLGEAIANPMIFVDEFDKATHSSVDDLYRPFYVLLEPTGSQRFVDAFLGFAMDASRVNWVMAANETEPVPRPVLDRLTIIKVRRPNATHLAAVAKSVFDSVNTRNGLFFEDQMPFEFIERLVAMPPRSMRIAVEHAMVVAASQGRREVQVDDLPVTASQERRRIGFV